MVDERSVPRDRPGDPGRTALCGALEHPAEPVGPPREHERLELERRVHEPHRGEQQPKGLLEIARLMPRCRRPLCRALGHRAPNGAAGDGHRVASARPGSFPYHRGQCTEATCPGPFAPPAHAGSGEAGAELAVSHLAGDGVRHFDGACVLCRTAGLFTWESAARHAADGLFANGEVTAGVVSGARPGVGDGVTAGVRAGASIAAANRTAPDE